MYIVFNTLNSGLGNNGGSRTLLKCAETIEKIGHRCDVIAEVDNFTWFKHKKPINYLPKDTDAIVATACTTVESTLDTDVPVKAWYIRGHESWAYSEDVLNKLYNAPLVNITNSYGLKKKVEAFGANAVVDVRFGTSTLADVPIEFTVLSKNPLMFVSFSVKVPCFNSMVLGSGRQNPHRSHLPHHRTCGSRIRRVRKI